MRTNTFLTLLLSAFLMTGCVDSDYDLSNASAGDIAIGDENMELEIPIVTFTLTIDDIDNTIATANSGGSVIIGATREGANEDTSLTLSDILTLANAFMPSGVSVDIQLLIYDETADSDKADLGYTGEAYAGDYSSYLEDLINQLIDELYTSSQKRLDLANQLIDYYEDDSMNMDEVITSFSIDEDLFKDGGDAEGIAEGIYDAIYDAKNPEDGDTTIADIIEDVKTYIQDEGILDALKDYANISDTTDITDEIDIPSSVTDMLGDTTITPSVSVESDLPFEIEITTLKISSGDNEEGIDFLDNDTPVDLDDILDILKSGSMSIDYAAALNSYSTGETTGEESLKIKVSMKVKGAIKL